MWNSMPYLGRCSIPFSNKFSVVVIFFFFVFYYVETKGWVQRELRDDLLAKGCLVRPRMARGVGSEISEVGVGLGWGKAREGESRVFGDSILGCRHALSMRRPIIESRVWRGNRAELSPLIIESRVLGAAALPGASWASDRIQSSGFLLRMNYESAGTPSTLGQ